MKAHSSEDLEKRFLLALALTALVLIAQVVGGVWSRSLALLSDSAHVFLDLFAIGMSFLALRLSALPPDDRHTYGYHRLEVLAALANGLSLVGLSAGIFYEAYLRWRTPTQVRSLGMLSVAALGLCVNLIVALMLARHRHPAAIGPHAREDLNVRSAFLHVLGDVLASVGVIAAGLIILLTGWEAADPLASAVIGVIILISSGRVLRSSLHILIEGVPEGLSLQQVADALSEVPKVRGVHDLHVWSLCSGHVALSAHVVCSSEDRDQDHALRLTMQERLMAEFGIAHTTLQLERDDCGQGQTSPSSLTVPASSRRLRSSA
jgi:cobalt-zinc-cadmium efflux system protein